MFNISRYKAIFPASIIALLIFTLLKIVWNSPKPLLFFCAVVFGISALLFILLNRSAKQTLIAQSLLLTLAWIVACASILGGIYRWDRGGWVWFQFTGYDVATAQSFPHLVDLPRDEFLTQNTIFVANPDDTLGILLREGNYAIDRTIVIPKGAKLTIEPGTVLRFNVDCSLVSYSPIIARGTESEPIKFVSQDKWRKWGVVGIVSKDKSIFEHTFFENGRRAHINGIDFWGALSLIESEVEISNSEFCNLFGKDGVNVGDGRVIIRNNVFRNCYKDGLDLDGGVGEISHNTFIDCEDEGIDLSANLGVVVFGNTILDSRGGRLGAEENYEKIVAANTFGYSKSAKIVE